MLFKNTLNLVEIIFLKLFLCYSLLRTYAQKSLYYIISINYSNKYKNYKLEINS